MTSLVGNVPPLYLIRSVSLFLLCCSTGPFACGELAAIVRFSKRSHMRPNCVVGAFPCRRSLSVGCRLVKHLGPNRQNPYCRRCNARRAAVPMLESPRARNPGLRQGVNS